MRAPRGLQARALREEPRVALAKCHELAVSREHQAVEKRHAQERAGLRQPLRDLAVLAHAPTRIAGWNTSRGWTSAADAVPIDTIWCAIGRWRPSM